MRTMKLPAAIAAVATTGAVAAGTIGVAGAEPPTRSSCPSGWACIYKDATGNGRPVAKFFHYGYHNLSNTFGRRVFLNRQTGGAVAFLCKGYDGRGPCEKIAAGQGVIRDFGPINSVYLRAR